MYLLEGGWELLESLSNTGRVSASDFEGIKEASVVGIDHMDQLIGCGHVLTAIA